MRIFMIGGVFMDMSTKTCSACQHDKAIEQYYDKHYSQCKSCHFKREMATEKAKPEQYSKYPNAYAKRNNDKTGQWTQARQKRYEELFEIFNRLFTFVLSLCSFERVGFLFE